MSKTNFETESDVDAYNAKVINAAMARLANLARRQLAEGFSGRVSVEIFSQIKKTRGGQRVCVLGTIDEHVVRRCDGSG